jgi:hypothetical protein
LDLVKEGRLLRDDVVERCFDHSVRKLYWC